MLLTSIRADREMTPRIVPDLIDIEQELFELPQKVILKLGIGSLWLLICGDSGARHLQ